MWFFEYAHPLGHWAVAKSLSQPRIVKAAGVERIGDGTGPRIRGLVEVHPDHAKLGLDELKQVYSQDGKFKATRPVRDAQGNWTTAQSASQGAGE